MCFPLLTFMRPHPHPLCTTGVIHGIAGLSNAQVNCWPLVMISGSCEQVGKGAAVAVAVAEVGCWQ